MYDVYVSTGISFPSDVGTTSPSPVSTGGKSGMIPLFPESSTGGGGSGISFDAVNGISLPAVALPSETAGVEEAGVLPQKK